MTPVHTPKQVSAERLHEMLAIATTLHAATFPVPAHTMRQVLTLALDAITRRSSAGVKGEAALAQLDEIADGAWGDNPMVRGKARDEAARLRALPSHAGEDDGAVAWVPRFDAVIAVAKRMAEHLGHRRPSDAEAEKAATFLWNCIDKGALSPLAARLGPSPSVPPQGETSDGMTLTADQVATIDRLDSALCQYLNNVGDEWDDPRWLVSVRRNLDELATAYNDCHVAKIMDLRAARAALASQTQGEGDKPFMWVVQWEWKKDPGAMVAGGGTSYPQNEAAADAEVARLQAVPGMAWAEKVALYAAMTPTLEPSDAEVERAALALYEEDDAWSTALPWESLETSQANEYRRLARAALIASRQPTSGEME